MLFRCTLIYIKMNFKCNIIYTIYHTSIFLLTECQVNSHTSRLVEGELISCTSLAEIAQTTHARTNII